jgi:hypothetical protein
MVTTYRFLPAPRRVGFGKVSFWSDNIAILSNFEDNNLYTVDILTGTFNLVRTNLKYATIIDDVVWAITPSETLVILDPETDYQTIKELGHTEGFDPVVANIPGAGRCVLLGSQDFLEVYTLNGTRLQSYNLSDMVIDGVRWQIAAGPAVNSQGDAIFTAFMEEEVSIETIFGLIVIPAAFGQLHYNIDAAFVLTTNEVSPDGEALPLIDNDDSFWSLRGREINHFAPDGERLESFRIQLRLGDLQTITPRGDLLFGYEEDDEWGLMLVTLPK